MKRRNIQLYLSHNYINLYGLILVKSLQFSFLLFSWKNVIVIPHFLHFKVFSWTMPRGAVLLDAYCISDLEKKKKLIAAMLLKSAPILQEEILSQKSGDHNFMRKIAT